MEKLTVEQIVNQTIEHIEKNGRSIDIEGSGIKEKTFCRYLNKEGKQCAVSIWLNVSDNEKRSYDQSYLVAIRNVLIENNFDYSIFKEKARFENTEFWTQLQNLHDNEYIWEATENGLKLSDYGIRKKKRIIDEFS